MKPRAFLLSLVVAMFTVAGPAHSADAQGAAGVQIVKNFLNDIRGAMASKDPAKVRAVAERYMDEEYVQHSRGYPPGREGFIKGMSSAVAGPPPGAPPGNPPPGSPPPGSQPSGNPPPGGPPPGGRPMPKDLYFFGDGEYVVWVSEGMEPGKLVFNMVRVVNGKMKEHWDSN